MPMCANAAPVRVLFVGNSLTYTNDLPSMVAKLAERDGLKIATEAVARPGFSLADHLADGTFARRLREEKWSFVVMQQGPSALPESRAELIRSAIEVAKMARAAGATPVLFMVWPSKSRSFDFDRVSESYRQAAAAANARLAAAGDAWRDAWKKDPSLQLYGPDNFHPSEAGSRLAAETIAKTIAP